MAGVGGRGPIVTQSAAGPGVVQGEEGGHRPVQGSCPIHECQSGGGEPGAPLEGQLGSGGGRAPAELAGGAPDEDVVAGGVQHPVVPFARVVVVAGHLDEALIE